MRRTAAVLLALAAAVALAGCAQTADPFTSPGQAVGVTVLLVFAAAWLRVAYVRRWFSSRGAVEGIEAVVDEAFRVDLRQSRKCLAVTDHDARVLWQEKGARFPLAWALADVIGRDLRERIPAGPDGDVQRAAYEASLNGVQPPPYVALMRDAHGLTAWIEVEHTPRSDGGTVIRYRDCTAEHAATERLTRERDAEHDRADRAERAAVAAGRAQVATSRLPDPSWTPT